MTSQVSSRLGFVHSNSTQSLYYGIPVVNSSWRVHAVAGVSWGCPVTAGTIRPNLYNRKWSRQPKSPRLARKQRNTKTTCSDPPLNSTRTFRAHQALRRSGRLFLAEEFIQHVLERELSSMEEGESDEEIVKSSKDSATSNSPPVNDSMLDWFNTIFRVLIGGYAALFGDLHPLVSLTLCRSSSESSCCGSLG